MINIFRKIIGAPKRAATAIARRKAIAAGVTFLLGLTAWQVSPEFRAALIDLIDALVVMFHSATQQSPEALLLFLR